MRVNGKFAGITRADLLAMADRFGIGTAPKVLKQVAETVADWPGFAAASGIGAEESQRIRGHHRLLCRE
jgi:serine/threonine-protein kinase HipA